MLSLLKPSIAKVYYEETIYNRFRFLSKRELRLHESKRVSPNAQSGDF